MESAMETTLVNQEAFIVYINDVGEIKEEPPDNIEIHPSTSERLGVNLEADCDIVSKNCDYYNMDLNKIKPESSEKIRNLDNAVLKFEASESHLQDHEGYTIGKSSDDLMEQLRTCSDLVDFLINFRFSLLSNNAKMFVKNHDVPRPDLSTTLMTQGKSTRSFVNSWYDKCNWLTGSKKRTKLFCWPCLLFANSGEEVWWKTGYNDLKNLARTTERHSRTKVHLSSCCKLKLFGREIISVGAHTQEIQNYNQSVKNNRKCLKRLIDIVIHLAKQEQAFGGHDESLNANNFKELMELMSKWDISLKTFLEYNGIFSKSSKDTQKELSESIAFVVREALDSEIKNAKFIAWQIDQTSDIMFNSKMSLIFRYVKDGTVVERFLGFFDSADDTAEILTEIISEYFNKFDLKFKLIAQTNDGTPVVAGLETKIPLIAPKTLFTYSHAHCLDFVLMKSCCSIKSTRLFFANLSGFATFFSESSERTYLLNQIGGSNTRWNFTSRAVTTVYSNKSKLIEVFDHIINSQDFDGNSIRESCGLKKLLEDQEFNFFLAIFHSIFKSTEVLIYILQSKFSDSTYFKSRLIALVKTLTNMKNSEECFNNIFEGPVEPLAKRKKIHGIDDSKQLYRQFYSEILDTVINQVKIRFEDTLKLSCFDLLDKRNFDQFYKNFPNHSLDSFVHHYSNLFNREQLKNELNVLYTENILGNTNTPLEMLRFITSTGLDELLPELFKFISLIVTLPITPVECKISTLKRVKNFARNSLDRKNLCSVALISIEAELVDDLSKSDEFYEKIIDHFAKMNNRGTPLLYRK